MAFENPVFLLEEVSSDQEVEVETTETQLFDPLTDHTYIFKESRDAPDSDLPSNFKIRQLKVLYHCKKCGFDTLKKDTMDAHSREHKDKPKPKPKPKTVQPAGKCVPCPSCNPKEPPQQYEKCTECSFFTKKKTSLKIHMRLHMNDKSYKCTECETRVATLKELIKHYETDHKPYQRFRCKLCGFSTHSRAYLAAHAQGHGETQKCGACDFSTTHSKQMARHVKTHYIKINI